MKKIAFCISSISSTGGTERVSTEIANALIKEGFEVSFISLFNGFNPKFTLDSNIKLFELYEEKKAFTKHYFNIVSKVKTIVDKEGIDILVGVDTILSMYLVPVSFLCRKKVRVFAWEHFNCNVDFNLKSRKLARFIAAKFADKTIVLTSKDMGLWQAKYKGIKNLICIPNPCVPMVAPINPFNEREKIVLAVGRLTYQKGFDILIDAWSLVNEEKRKKWKLVIVGSGEDEIKLRVLIESLNLSNSVQLHAATSNIDKYYNRASIFCMSSRFEGLPMVLLEAQYYQLPIVSFDCDTGPSDVVLHGVNGILCEINSAQNLANALSDILDDEVKMKSYSENTLVSSNKFKIENIVSLWRSII